MVRQLNFGDGDLKAFTIEIDKVSASAKAKVEAAGGQVKLLDSTP